jgi:hypothetical protein
MVDFGVLDRAFAGDGFSHAPLGALRVRSGRVVAADPVSSGFAGGRAFIHQDFAGALG